MSEGMTDTPERLTDEELKAVEGAGVAWCGETTFARLFETLRAERTKSSELETRLKACGETGWAKYQEVEASAAAMRGALEAIDNGVYHGPHFTAQAIARAALSSSPAPQRWEAAMRQVWVTEHLDYDGGVDGFYISDRAAVRGLKTRYGSPYRVEWSEKRDKDGWLLLTGQFEAVQGYSIEHVATWEIRCENVEV